MRILPPFACTRVANLKGITIRVVKAKTAEGFVPNTAASVNKARHSQPPVGSKILLEMYRKYKESWIVELLFDDLYDWNRCCAPPEWSLLVVAADCWCWL